MSKTYFFSWTANHSPMRVRIPTYFILFFLLPRIYYLKSIWMVMMYNFIPSLYVHFRACITRYVLGLFRRSQFTFHQTAPNKISFGSLVCLNTIFTSINQENGGFSSNQAKSCTAKKLSPLLVGYVWATIGKRGRRS